jgi:molybdenum cofactor cytidylyltransferase
VIAGIILAAGASRRMGSPKALLNYRGETFIDRLVRVISAACDPVIVVLGYHADAIRAQVRGQVRFVVNPDPERGQLSSLQSGLMVVPPESDGVLFTPVDSPAVEPKTVSRLAEAFARRDPATLLVIPRFNSKRGHPVCVSRSVIAELLALPPAGQAREVIRRHADRTQYVDVEDAGVLADIDDPEAYRRLAGTAR